MRNESLYSRSGYGVSLQQLLRSLKKVDELKMRVLAIYHSHPDSDALPSARDKKEAAWTVPYLILSMRRQEARAFLLPAAQEVPISVE